MRWPANFCVCNHSPGSAEQTERTSELTNYTTSPVNQYASWRDVTLAWRGVLPVHPAAELFDLTSGDEFKALTENIVQAKGLRNPIIIYVAEDGTEQLIDGRNRLNALEIAGFEPVKNGKLDYANVLHQRVSGVNPYDLALSLNLHRRNLDLPAKRKLIARLLKLKPEASDRQIAALVAVSHNTVAAIRFELESTGQIDQCAVRIGRKGARSRQRSRRSRSSQRRPSRRRSWPRQRRPTAQRPRRNSAGHITRRPTQIPISPQTAPPSTRPATTGAAAPTARTSTMMVMMVIM